MSQSVKASFGQSEEVFYRSQITIYLNIKLIIAYLVVPITWATYFRLGIIGWLAGNQMDAIEYINAFSGSFFVLFCVCSL